MPTAKKINKVLYCTQILSHEGTRYNLELCASYEKTPLLGVAGLSPAYLDERGDVRAECIRTYNCLFDIAATALVFTKNSTVTVHEERILSVDDYSFVKKPRLKNKKYDGRTFVANPPN